MRLIVTQNTSMIADVSCDREDLYIGSHDECRVKLTDPRIPPQLAVITPEDDGSWIFTPLDEEQVVQINAANVTEKVTLKTGDEVRVWDYVIRVFPEHKPQEGQAAARRRTSVARLTKFVQTHLPPGSATKRPEEALALRAGELRGLGEIIVNLSGANTPEELMDVATKTLLRTFGAFRAWIGIRRVNYGPMDYVQGQLLSGQNVELPEIGADLKPRVMDRGQAVLIPRISREQRWSVLVGPLPGPDGPLGMVYIDSGEGGRRYEPEDLDQFIVISGLVAAQLDSILRQIAKNRSAMIAGEVSVAHAIQARLTPRKLPQWDELSFGAFRELGGERTGDLYDIVRLGNNQAGILVAYTRSTGAIPSMLMGQAQAAFRLAAMHQDPPDVFLKSMNWMLYDGLKDRELHCFVGQIDPASGAMRYAIAGDVGAFIISGRGEERMLGPTPPAAALSLAKSTDYPALSETLENGEALALFTPGVTTATNPNGEVFGRERFVDILCDGFGQLASAMLKEMYSDLRGFTEGGAQPDDITVVLAHRS